MSAMPIFAYSPSNSKLTENGSCDMNHCILELAVTPWLSRGAILIFQTPKTCGAGYIKLATF